MYAKVMVPLDGSKLAECVLPHLRHLAQSKLVKNIVLVRVVEPVQPAAGGEYVISEEDAKRLNAEHRRDAEDYLQRIASRLKFDGIKVEWKVLFGRVADILVDFSTEKKMSLVLIATHGRSGVSRWIFGSVANRLLQSTCVPTLLIRPPECKPSW